MATLSPSPVLDTALNAVAYYQSNAAYQYLYAVKLGIGILVETAVSALLRHTSSSSLRTPCPGFLMAQRFIAGGFSAGFPAPGSRTRYRRLSSNPEPLLLAGIARLAPKTELQPSVSLPWRPGRSRR